MQTWTERLDATLIAVEQRIGRWPLALVIGGILYLLGMAYVAGVDFRSGPHGKLYMALSMAPFDLSQSNAVGYRRLGPMLGWLLGLRGERFLWLTIAASVLIPTSIYGGLRQRALSPASALAMACLINFSGVVLIHFIARGYVDPLYYLLVLWAFLWQHPRGWPALLFLLAMMTHEAVLVLWPAWSLLRFRVYRQAGASGWAALLEALPVLGLWIAWRSLLSAQSEADFSLAFYFNEENLRYMLQTHLAYVPLGAFCALKTGWALPLRALSIYTSQRDWLALLTMLALLGGITSQVLIALDLGRLFSLAFPALLIASLDLQRASDVSLAPWLWRLTAFSLLLGFYYVAGTAVHPMLPWS
jgi:hypothetical protein